MNYLCIKASFVVFFGESVKCSHVAPCYAPFNWESQETEFSFFLRMFFPFQHQPLQQMTLRFSWPCIWLRGIWEGNQLWNLFFFLFLFSDSLNNVQVTSSSPVPMPQMALGLIPTTNVAPPQPMSTEQINLQFQKKLEDLEQQVGESKQL